MNNTVINTNIVKHVLGAFAEGFLVDVPAVHRDGQYLIRYESFVDHINNLNTDDLVQIMFEVEERYAGV